MPDEETKDLEEPQIEVPNESGEKGDSEGVAKVRRPYSRLAVELDEDDLDSKGVHKLMMAEMSKLEGEVYELKSFREQFHDRDKECAKLRVRLKKNTMVEILYTVAVGAAFVLVGLTQSTSSFKDNAILIIVALALLIFAIIAKWRGGKDES